MGDIAADGPKVDLKANGNGPQVPYSTADPNVQAGDAANPAAAVSGTPEQATQEGLEHIKNNIDQPAAGGTSALTGQPPASNPGSGDATGGIARGSGGVSSAAHVLSPVADSYEETKKTVVDTVKEYLGFGPKNPDGTPNENAAPSSTKANEGTTAAGVLGGAASLLNFGSKKPDDATATRNVEVAGTPNELPSDTSASGVDPSRGTTSEAVRVVKEGSGASTITTTGTAAAESAVETAGTAAPQAKENIMDEPTQDQRDMPAAPERAEPTSNINSNVDNDVTSGAPPTESADPTTHEGPADVREGDAEADTKPKTHSDQSTGNKRENKDAIPTAGGERLGQKHWGESGIVPDVPKPQPEQGQGVSSSEGQPTGESLLYRWTCEKC
jgi:hypothetical protein